MVVNLARSFQSKVEILMDQQRADASEILQLLSLGAVPGRELIVEAAGPDAEAAADALAQLFAEGFGEEEK
jgi:phosphotransferase system HPr (HPr) family protein